MANTKAGGIKVRKTMIEKYGSEEAWKEFMRGIAAKGGAAGRTGGFFANRELARIAGAKGGRISKRGQHKKPIEPEYPTQKSYSRLERLLRGRK